MVEIWEWSSIRASLEAGSFENHIISINFVLYPLAIFVFILETSSTLTSYLISCI